MSVFNCQHKKPYGLPHVWDIKQKQQMNKTRNLTSADHRRVVSGGEGGGNEDGKGVRHEVWKATGLRVAGTQQSEHMSYHKVVHLFVDVAPINMIKKKSLSMPQYK